MNGTVTFDVLLWTLVAALVAVLAVGAVVLLEGYFTGAGTFTAYFGG